MYINKKPWKSGGKYLFILVIILSAFVGCLTNGYKYKICKAQCQVGVKKHKKTLGTSCIWYADTFQIKHDTLMYYNSDSSVIVVSPPYVVIRRK